MMRALWTAASGMKSQQTNVDVISNNISNVNTVGYKSEKAEFKSLLYQTIQAKTTSANGEEKPIPAQVGLGTRLASTTSNYTNGSLLESDTPGSFAIQGDGFFQIRGADGNLYYTRNGNFNWMTGTNGVTLCTQEGYQVLDSNGQAITLPANVNSEAVVYSKTSKELGYTNAAGEYVSLNQSFGIYQFNNPAGLEKTGNNLLEETDASGAAMNEATTQGLTQSTVYDGYLEGSNVNVADEMVNLIVAQRAYELNSKAIQAADSMLGQANQLRS